MMDADAFNRAEFGGQWWSMWSAWQYMRRIAQTHKGLAHGIGVEGLLRTVIAFQPGR